MTNQTNETPENLHTFHPFPSDATPQQICNEINKGLDQVDKIARALFIGEKLLSEHSAYAGLTELSKPYCLRVNFTAWIESPEGLKAVRDALFNSGITYTIYRDAISYGFVIYKKGLRELDHHGTEHEAILSATEAFLRDE